MRHAVWTCPTLTQAGNTCAASRLLLSNWQDGPTCHQGPLSPRISRPVLAKVHVAMYKPSRQVSDAQSCSYFVIDNHDSVNTCTIITSDGTVVLRNASQHHTIYYRVQPSKEALTSSAASCRLREEQASSQAEPNKYNPSPSGARRNPLTTSIYPCTQHFAHQYGVVLVREDMHSLQLLRLAH